MKFGTFELVECPESLSHSQLYHQEVELACHAERLGFDGFWLTEHHFNEYGMCTNPLMLGSYIAAKTERIRIGTAIIILPFHNPIRLAEDVALFDILSKGRLDLGIARGYQPPEYAGMNIPIGEGSEFFDEGLGVLLQGLTQERVNFKGKHYNFTNARVLPKPYQKPHPPIYVATTTPEKVRICIQRGFKLLYGSTDPGGGDMSAGTTYRQIAREEGVPEWKIAEAVSSFPKTSRVYIADSDEQAWGEIKPHLQWFIDHFLGQASGSEKAGGKVFESAVKFMSALGQPIDRYREMDIYGTPETCIRRIKELRDKYGIQYFMGWFTFGGLPIEKAKRSMERFAKEVMPAFK